MAINLKNSTFWGYKRENGRIGVRNHVIILPVDDLSNAACEAVAHNINPSTTDRWRRHINNAIGPPIE